MEVISDHNGPMKSTGFLILFTGLQFIGSGLWAAESEFWKGPFFWDKPGVAARMQVERYIPVSVISAEEAGQSIWWMKGAGIVEAPAEYILNYSKDITKLAQQQDHFSDVQWQPDKSEMSFTFRALGRSERFKIKIWETKEANSPQSQTKTTYVLHFHFLMGPLSGSDGVLLIKEVVRQESHVSLILRHQGNIFSFGGGILSIAVEGVLHHMAELLRTSVEQSWKATSKEKG